MKTPVVLIVFNRPQTTQKVFDAIRAAKPSHLLVVADGPRKERTDDAEKCAAVRSIIDQVDWKCELSKHYAEKNLGCAHSPAQGINWAFENVEEAIILEDDCVPEPDFFRFCDELLEKYRYDERIMHISGNNFFPEYCLESSYTFSRYSLSWGWATWKRAWQHYDFNLEAWPEVKSKNLLKDFFVSEQAIRSWENTFQIVYEGRIDAWDYQWTLSCWLQHGLSIVPATNLVTNIGFGSDATHTHENSSNLDLSSRSIGFPLLHPQYIFRDNKIDELIQKKMFNYSRSLNQRVIDKLKQTIKLR